MGDANNEAEEQTQDKQSEQVKTCKIYVKQPHEIMNSASLNSASLNSSPLKNTNENIERTIQGLREMPDEELKEFLDDEAFIEGLDVVDAWEGDEDKKPDIHSSEDKKPDIHSAEDRKPDIRPADPTKQQEKPSSREHHQRSAREHKGTGNREKSKKEEKKREDTLRRDPAKSSKDIERDKIRTKRDTESKLLAEKEKAIKHLLDSDNVVPPGTETEAIQSIAERQNLERAQQQRERRSRERRRSVDRYGRSSPSRRKSSDRVVRMSPHRRSAERRRMSPERHRSPLGYSPGGKRRNSPRYTSDRRSPSLSSPERRRSPRRLSWERRSSADRRWSTERHRRRDMHERRRSRSRDRRSRSTEHSRRRSSRSPTNRRYSPRRRSRTRSRSPDKRPRKRSPFINELARQLRNEALKPSGSNVNGNNSGGGYPPAAMLNVPVYQPDPADPTRQVLAGPAYMHQPGPQPPLPPQSAPPPPPPPSSMPMQSVPPNFMSFEMPVVPMSFDIPPMNPQPLPPADYASGPVMYNQPNAAPLPPPPPPPGIRAPMRPGTVPSSPQPVPAPVMDHGQMPYNPSHVQQPQSIHQFETKPSIASIAAAAAAAVAAAAAASPASSQSYDRKPFHQLLEERLKAPDPPVISKPKQFEKTSLSSLLEASVSAKDPSNIPVLYPGFNPEIMRHCEQALCQLPYEDPRLKMKGRFFYVRDEEDAKYETEDHGSNSILLQKSKTKVFWQENAEQPAPMVKPAAQMHQKICQTDEVETDTRGVQATVLMVDNETQVYPHEMQQVNREERRTIRDRLDWNVRETYDYAAKFREVDDLRLHLSNSSQRRSWNNRQPSPPPSRRPDMVEHEHHLEPVDRDPRDPRDPREPRDSRDPRDPRNRDNYPGHRMRDRYGHSQFSPEYTHSMERDVDYHEQRSEHSRGESPMELEESDENGAEDDDDVVAGHTFQPEWRGRGRTFRGKSHNYRGKHSGGRPYRSRGSYRGKF